MSNLFAAHRQWAERPDDERFETIPQMLAACRDWKNHAAERVQSYGDLHFTAPDENTLALTGPKGIPAPLTNYAFRQIARRVGAPTDYLQTLPTYIVAPLLEHGMRTTYPKPDALTSDQITILEKDPNGYRAKAIRGKHANLLFHSNGSLVVRSMMTQDYSRIWNVDVAERLRSFEGRGWQVPPARPVRQGQKGTRRATEQDVLPKSQGGGGLSVNVGDEIAPAGLYASSHDMFAFLVNENRVIRDGSPGGLARGFFIRNSEVGECSLSITLFHYRSVCGNHIVWGSQDVHTIRIRHIGNASANGLLRVAADVQRFADSSASEDEARIEWARRYELGATKLEVLDTILGKVRQGITRKTLSAGYDEAEKTEDNPRSVWGMINGLTRISQDTPFTDLRVDADEAAAKLMAVKF
jgi:hypothetical protein